MVPGRRDSQLEMTHRAPPASPTGRPRRRPSNRGRRARPGPGATGDEPAGRRRCARSRRASRRRDSRSPSPPPLRPRGPPSSSSIDYAVAAGAARQAQRRGLRLRDLLGLVVLVAGRLMGCHSESVVCIGPLWVRRRLRAGLELEAGGRVCARPLDAGTPRGRDRDRHSVEAQGIGEPQLRDPGVDAPRARFIERNEAGNGQRAVLALRLERLDLDPGGRDPQRPLEADVDLLDAQPLAGERAVARQSGQPSRHLSADLRGAAQRQRGQARAGVRQERRAPRRAPGGAGRSADRRPSRRRTSRPSPAAPCAPAGRRPRTRRVPRRADLRRAGDRPALPVPRAERHPAAAFEGVHLPVLQVETGARRRHSTRAAGARRRRSAPGSSGRGRRPARRARWARRRGRPPRWPPRDRRSRPGSSNRPGDGNPRGCPGASPPRARRRRRQGLRPRPRASRGRPPGPSRTTRGRRGAPRARAPAPACLKITASIRPPPSALARMGSICRSSPRPSSVASSGGHRRLEHTQRPGGGLELELRFRADPLDPDPGRGPSDGRSRRRGPCRGDCGRRGPSSCASIPWRRSQGVPSGLRSSRPPSLRLDPSEAFEDRPGLGRVRKRARRPPPGPG